jgi:dienelactone hydrolase
MNAFRCCSLALPLLLTTLTLAAAPAALPWTSGGSPSLDAYFRAETARIADHSLTDLKSLADWKAKRAVYHEQLLEMLGLWPLPGRTDLQPVITGKLEQEQFVVEKLHFQSLPGLYVTADLYLPKQVDKPLPTILYVCGHGQVKKNGVSYGNKTHYQHHGAWFAQHGYVCLVVDTIQLGELEGIHHGTHREGMWWWNSRGYTPAGVEAWNCIRALDYLETRPEVDKRRFGITGRSGGGAYSWWAATADDRIKVAVPVAGITDLQNHVVDGCVEGHCDCMFMVNTFRWDYAQVAALMAPRPLLLSNTDKDRIFPLDGVMRIRNKVAKIYDLYGASTNFGVLITEGPHADTQDLQVPAFRWFDRFLKGEQPLITDAARKFADPEQLKVFQELPKDERTTRIHETFVPAARPMVPRNTAEWAEQRDTWLEALKEKAFAGWPTEAEAGPLNVRRVFAAEHQGVHVAAYDFNSQPQVTLRIYLAWLDGREPKHLLLTALDDRRWRDAMATLRSVFPDQLKAEGQLVTDVNPAGLADLQNLVRGFDGVLAGVSPRGTGLDAWKGDAKKLVQLRRRFQLLGQTVDGMRVWDIQRAAAALRSQEAYRPLPLVLQGEEAMGVNVLYAGLFVPDVAHFELRDLPGSHMKEAPDYLNVLRILDLPQAVALAADRAPTRLEADDAATWAFPVQTARSLGGEVSQFKLESK